jgi:hypothetical protein
MTYIVSKRKAVCTVGAGGVLMNFDDYCSAIETARGAAKVLEDVATTYRSRGGLEERTAISNPATHLLENRPPSSAFSICLRSETL